MKKIRDMSDELRSRCAIQLILRKPNGFDEYSNPSFERL